MNMDSSGLVIMPSKEQNMPKTTSSADCILEPEDVSKGQLEVRFKRYHEQFSTIHELLMKVSISVSRLELENNSLREQNEYWMKKSGLWCKRGNPKKSNVNPPSAARAAVELALVSVENMQSKVVIFENVALSQRKSTDEATLQNQQIKVTLDKVKEDLQKEKKKTEHFQEKINFMENEYVKEVALRIAAERHLSSLQKEVQELTNELSAQMSRQNTEQIHITQSVCDTDHQSPVRNNVVITSTPHVDSVHRIGTGRSFHNSPFMQTNPTVSKGFQNVFVVMGDRINKFGNKFITFVGSRKAFRTAQDELAKRLTLMFKFKPSKIPTSYMVSMAKMD